VETLESIRQQTYSNIEIIITDDCSTDKTIYIIKDWISKNEYRFSSTCLVQSTKNTGISANCNRGLLEAKGTYIKIIAGDDVLLSNCIEDNMHYAMKHNSKIIFSKLKILSELTDEDPRVKNVLICQEEAIEFLKWSTNQQLSKLVTRNYLLAPCSFFNRRYLMDVGGFDERFIMEDYPLWLKSLELGVKFHFLDKTTVLYRIHGGQSTASEEGRFKKWFLEDEYKIYKLMRKRHLSPLMKWNEELKFLIAFKVFNSGNTQQEYSKWRWLMLLSPQKYMLVYRDKIQKYKRMLRI
jgi:Predicted glycosyltransferases